MIEIEIYEGSLTDALTETKSLAITQRESSLSYKLISWLYFQHLGVINEIGIWRFDMMLLTMTHQPF